jgi:predicted amidophosphoribosyltransferase
MWDWVFPSLCAVCGEPTYTQERRVCWRCFLRLPQTLTWRAPQANEAYYRLRPHVPIAGAVAGFWYTAGSPLRPLVQRAKYSGDPLPLYAVSQAWGHLLRAECPALGEVHAFLPVPLSKVRLRKRGYNQAAWVARGLAEAWEKPLLKKVWIRDVATVSQVGKARAARWETLEGAFRVVGALPAIVAVVDDVLTTGATLRAAIQSLPPDVRVWVVTIGLTQRRL